MAISRARGCEELSEGSARLARAFAYVTTMVRPGRPVERAWRDLVSLATLEWLAQPSRNTRKVTFVRLYSSCIATHTTPMPYYTHCYLDYSHCYPYYSHCYPDYSHATVLLPILPLCVAMAKRNVRTGVAIQSL